MQKEINFYKNRVALNVLTNSIPNAIKLYSITEGHIVLGILSADYPSIESAIIDMQKYQLAVNNAISVGLGAGNPKQWKAVAKISQAIQPQHANQVFPAVGYTRASVDNQTTFINTLVSPTGTSGLVKITTGAISKDGVDGIIPIEAAINLIKDMGGNSIKLFPMHGLSTKAEYIAVAKACAKANFALEPTGGIDLNNFEEILQIAVDAGVPKIIPHVYSSIIDKTTGETRSEDVKLLFEIIKKVLA
ncbi:4-hydroxy-2-ketovalerate aldolase [Erysipelotrichaceae bacterium]|nr:4-hydroxy-2-ketovalerate aldolase [Erysipelotrichaceae bacterium]